MTSSFPPNAPFPPTDVLSGYVLTRLTNISGDGEFLGVRFTAVASGQPNVGVYEQQNRVIGQLNEGAKVVLTTLYISGDITTVSGVVVIDPLIHIDGFIFNRAGNVTQSGTSTVTSGTPASGALWAPAPVGSNIVEVASPGTPPYTTILSIGV